MKTYKVKFSGKDYRRASEEGWLDSLAVFLVIVKKHSGKSFYFKKTQKTNMLRRLSMKTGIGMTSLQKHIGILVKNEMITMKEGAMCLKSNRKMKSNNHKVLFIKDHINNLSDIKLVLKNIPFLSNLKKQKFAFLKKEHNKSIHVKLQSGFAATPKEKKSLLKFSKKNGGSFEGSSKLTCGLNKMKEILNKESNSTVCKYKKRLKELKLIDYNNELHAIMQNVTYADFTYLRSNDFAECRGAFFCNGSIYLNKPTEYVICY